MEKEEILKIISEPDFYSYYISSNHTKDDEEQMKLFGVCNHCGYWQKAYCLDDIPEILRIDNQYRKHWYDKRIADIVKLLTNTPPARKLEEGK